MNLREKQSQQRRTRILDEAERLIRKSRSTEFSVRKLAAAAEVSPATPYNIFGSKEGILYSLLLRTLDDFMEKGFVFRDRDSRMHFIEAARNAVDILIADADFQRPLYQVLMGVTHEQHRPEFMARTFLYWRHAVETIPRSERLARQQDIDLLAHSLMAHFTGLMEMWINFDMTDEEFSAHVTCAAIIDAYSFLRPEDQREMLELLDKTKAGLPLRPAHGGAVATLRVKTA